MAEATTTTEILVRQAEPYNNDKPTQNTYDTDE